MPILKDFRQTKEIVLPSYPDSKIVIYNSLLAGDISFINLNEQNQTEQAFEFLPRFIKSWNFEKTAGVALEISKENLALFSIQDLTFIINEVQKFSQEVKKNLEQ